MRFPLKIKRWTNPFVSGPNAMWRESAPFVHNKRGLLIHRPRFVSVYNRDRGTHIAVEYYCGNHVTDNVKRGNLTFIDAPNGGDMVCHACEQRAVMAGLPTSTAIAGTHVHTGKLKAIPTCCQGSAT